MSKNDNRRGRTSKSYKDYNNRTIKRPIPEKGSRPTVAPKKKDKKS